ncbi:TRAP transporter substrate-binding protein DctP [Phaeovulum sp.]|jgi:C4-dicarboxylate-binding protein DctP|uniref:TRAP transporter substrate-binding protein DctP n=1 Tax=Phaeovulum sp. TaxID=2934796 RepID=UPI00272FB611|nr:TRAP transporter substrate-binding protein DctP [Phaeovulum sp.]MDP1670098.1 TRAP transporter substrate-binding protein DctP [Phaeovulum sp.]MDZ4118340.1 TRAP transporter substrate-binding protein DctP [Phaeovulum sp.]
MKEYISYSRSLAGLALTATLALASLTGYAAAETKYRISVDTGPNHVRNITLRVFMERLAAATSNELVGELFEAGQLYAARDEPKAVAQGDIEMSVTTNSSIAAFVSNMNLLDLPLFSGRSPEQVNQLVDGELGAALAANIGDKLGLVVPGRWFLLGFTNTFGAGRDLTSFADFKGARIRVPGGAGFIARYKALGAEGVSIPFPDVPMALSQGAIDALLTTNETLRSAKLFEAGVKSVFVDQVSVLYYVPLVNKKFWDSLSAEHQKAFRDAWESVIDEERAEAVRRQAAAAEENAANGVVIHEPDPAELAEVNARLLALAPEIAVQLGVDPAIVALAQAEIAKLN